MIITDGQGKGTSVAVTLDNELCVLAVTQPEDRHLAVLHGAVWSLPFEAIDPVGADDYFFYMTNTGSTDLALTHIRISSTVVGVVDVKHVSGAPSYVSATAVTPVSRKLGSTRTPGATINTDTNITNLTDKGILFFIDLDVVSRQEHLNITSNIIIPQGQAVALMWSAATGILSGTVTIVELV